MGVEQRRFDIDYGRLRQRDYDAVLRMSGVGLAWEFLRRNTDFQTAWASAQTQEVADTQTENSIVVRKLVTQHPAASRWGLVAYPFRH